LHQTRGRTGSERTHHEYASTLSAYRQALAQAGLDLDSEPRACALVLQAYAAARVAERAELGEVGARRRRLLLAQLRERRLVEGVLARFEGCYSPCSARARCTRSSPSLVSSAYCA
jgi:hypothetical protein